MIQHPRSDPMVLPYGPALWGAAEPVRRMLKIALEYLG